MSALLVQIGMINLLNAATRQIAGDWSQSADAGSAPPSNPKINPKRRPICFPRALSSRDSAGAFHRKSY